jgi:hypothetical protein
MRKIIPKVLVLFSFFALAGAHPPKEVPSVMTLKQMNAYQEGIPVDENLPAETFGYPNPQRVLDLAQKLDLSAEQKGQIQNLLTITLNRALYFGRKIVAEELLLDDFFRKGEEDYAALSNRLESIGNSRWRLRLAHLEAYLKTKMVLNSDQLKKYHELCAASPEGVSSK